MLMFKHVPEFAVFIFRKELKFSWNEWDLIAYVISLYGVFLRFFNQMQNFYSHLYKTQLF